MSTVPPHVTATRILAIDTSTVRGSISLLEGPDAVAGLRLRSFETHSARLLKSIEFLLSSAGWELRSLGLVAVASGPGSFTGIRIGVATGLGLAQTLGLPVIAVSVLDAVARKVPVQDGKVLVVMDAQRMQVYCAGYEIRAGRVRQTIRPQLRAPEDLGKRIAGKRIYVAGDALPVYGRVLTGSATTGWPRPLQVDLFVADEIGRLGLQRKRHWKRGEFLTAEPLYIRPPDAAKARKTGRRQTS